jgi:hypothetical protein
MAIEQKEGTMQLLFTAPRTTGAVAATAVTAAALAAAVTLSNGFTPSLRKHDTTTPEAPAWFAAIRNAYGANSNITPRTDFAALYGVRSPRWFAPIARAYGGRVSPSFDFASLYAGSSR